MYTVDSKHFLYFSKECEYCLEVLDLLRKYNMNCMNLVSVDEQDTLPRVVTCVPLIITNSNTILIDEEVIKFINHMYMRSLESIDALVDDQSAAFSFIDETDEKQEIAKRGFDFIDDEDTNYEGENKDISQLINIDTQNKGKIDKNEFERYAQQRESDDSQFKSQRRY